MVIYVDLVFLLNFSINFFILLIIEILSRDKIKYLSISLASFLGGGIIIGFILNYLIFTMFQIFGGILISLIAYYHNNPQKIIIKTASFYLINLALVGLLTVFKIKSFLLLGICLLSIIIIVFLEANRKYYLYLNAKKYQIHLEIKNYTFDIMGYVDSGNLAMSQDNKPLVFINTKYYKTDLIQNCEIEIKTVNGVNKVLAYRPDVFYFKVKNKRIYKDVLIAFIDLNQEFDCLLNAWLFI